MKALMVSSTSGDVIQEKMRDERYMRHLREVEKINNREAEQISRDIKTYHSINNLHKKHKAQASDWHQRQNELLISLKNKQIQQKIVNIHPYTQFRYTTALHATEQPDPQTSEQRQASPSPSQ
jgi:alpha-ketoglutarate-dependent taurine dioxygenase